MTDFVKCIGGVLDGQTVDGRGDREWVALKRDVHLVGHPVKAQWYVDKQHYRRENLQWVDGRGTVQSRWFFVLDGIELADALGMLYDGYREPHLTPLEPSPLPKGDEVCRALDE